MSSFSGSFRRFKEGLQWSLLHGYWRTIREHAWETLWGAGIVGIGFVFYTLYRAPSLQLLGWVVAWIILVQDTTLGVALKVIYRNLSIYQLWVYFWHSWTDRL